LPIDPKTGVLIDGEIGEKTVRVIKNVEAILQAVGANLNNVVKTTVFLKDISNFTEMNEVYNKYFEDSLPARSAVRINALPKGADIEMEVIAYLS
jgi:2-iminobutanoate/2-iminopropanoate deaminase